MPLIFRMLCLTLTFLLFGYSASAKGIKPNVILILADDAGVETINAYGGEYYTPHLDEIARKGMLFSNAHATPLCTPTRVRLMTGKYNFRNYEAFGFLSPSEKTIAHYFKDSGYKTAISGKWQLSGNQMDGRTGTNPKDAGFDEHHVWQLHRDKRGSRYWGPTVVENGEMKIHEDGFGPDFHNQFAIDFIKENKNSKFFLYYTLALPHSPWVTTPGSLKAESDKDRFSGMISYMDKMVGNINTALRDAGIDDNSIIIFVGDNGTHRDITSYRNQVAVRGNKGGTTDAGTHVPLIVKWPAKLQPGSVYDGLVDILDLTATVTEIAGVEKGDLQMDGLSLVPIIKGKKKQIRESIFMHYSPRWNFQPSKFVFDTRWKLYGDMRFYNLSNDILEQDPISLTQMTSEQKSAYERLSGVLLNMNDGPLADVWIPPDARK